MSEDSLRCQPFLQWDSVLVVASYVCRLAVLWRWCLLTGPLGLQRHLTAATIHTGVWGIQFSCSQLHLQLFRNWATSSALTSEYSHFLNKSILFESLIFFFFLASQTVFGFWKWLRHKFSFWFETMCMFDNWNSAFLCCCVCCELQMLLFQCHTWVNDFTTVIPTSLKLTPGETVWVSVQSWRRCQSLDFCITRAYQMRPLKQNWALCIHSVSVLCCFPRSPLSWF